MLNNYYKIISARNAVLLFRKAEVILNIHNKFFTVISELKNKKRLKKATDKRKEKKKGNKSCVQIELPVPSSSVTRINLNQNVMSLIVSCLQIRKYNNN